MTNERDFEQQQQDAFVKYMQSQVGKLIDPVKHDAMIRSFGAKRTSRTIWNSQGCFKINFDDDENVTSARFHDDEYLRFPSSTSAEDDDHLQFASSSSSGEDDFEIDHEAIERHHRMYHCSTPTPQKKRSTKKKGSLKPSRPLTDEERDALFGKPKDLTIKTKLPKTKKSAQEGQQKKKKNSGKAPNAIRKTKKPSRL